MGARDDRLWVVTGALGGIALGIVLIPLRSYTSASNLAFVFLAFVIVMAELGGRSAALLTAVVGLSLRDTLGNLFAGLAIQAQRPFQIGDWIQFENDPRHFTSRYITHIVPATRSDS